jgi:hypothetical protein
MNFRRRLLNKRIRNNCQVHIMDADRKPTRCRNQLARFANTGEQRVWLCGEHYRMFKAGDLISVETKNLEVVFADCRGRGKS